MLVGVRGMYIKGRSPAVTHLSKVTAGVATVEWVRREMEMPVPEVVAQVEDYKAMSDMSGISSPSLPLNLQLDFSPLAHT